MKPTNDEILAAALKLATAKGYTRVTREAIAEAVRISPALVSVRMGTMPTFRRALMRYAVRMRCLPVIAQGLAARDRYARKAPADLRAAALMTL